LAQTSAFANPMWDNPDTLTILSSCNYITVSMFDLIASMFELVLV